MTTTPPPELTEWPLGPNDKIDLPPALVDDVRKGICTVGNFFVPKKWTMGAAFVQNSRLMANDCLINKDDRGPALPGDLVVVRLAGRELWQSRNSAKLNRDEPHVPSGYGKPKEGEQAFLEDGRPVQHILDPSKLPPQKVVRPLDLANASVGADGEPFCSDANPFPPTLQCFGRIEKVLYRGFKRQHACRLTDARQMASRGKGPNAFVKFKSYDESFPHIAVRWKDIPLHFMDELDQFLLLVSIIVEPDNTTVDSIDGLPRGIVTLSLGRAGSVEAESRAITFTAKIRDEAFSEEVEDDVLKEFVIPPPAELKRMHRRDLRDEEFVCTIDPATARDLDDALSCQRVSGGYRIGVHIADVSHFVPLGSAVDCEAQARSTSTYMVERVIPMLPRRLCEDYCSLNAGSDKFAFSVIWHMDLKGNIKSEWFGQSVIRNSCRMAYEDAQRIIEGDHSGESLVIDKDKDRPSTIARVVESTLGLYEVAGKMRERRYERGALSLNKGKLKFRFEDYNSKLAPCGFGLERTKEANWVIEEFMLLANIRVAEKIVEFLPQYGMIRKHDKPQPKKLKSFVAAGKQFGFDISAKTAKALNNSLEKYKEHPDSDALRVMATYCMSLAKYCCSGEDEDGPVSHFAISTPLYTHFTSPIRRYADLVVHRQLLLALDVEAHVKKCKGQGLNVNDIHLEELYHGEYYMHPADVSFVATHANQQKEAARKAGELSQKQFFCLYLEAIRLRHSKDPSFPEFCYVEVVVTKVVDNKFTMFAKEIATDVEVYMNAQAQKWDNHAQVKDSPTGEFTLNWKSGPERVCLFHKMVVQLRVEVKAYSELTFIVVPPNERDKVPIGVPTSMA